MSTKELEVCRAEHATIEKKITGILVTIQSHLRVLLWLQQFTFRVVELQTRDTDGVSDLANVRYDKLHV